MKTAPDDAYEYKVCSDCLIALANDDYSGMDDAQETVTRAGLNELQSMYRSVIPDGAEYGFCNSACECCGGLPGDRFRVICFDKKGE